MSCDRIAVYTATVCGILHTCRMPIRDGVTPPESIFRQGNFLTLTAVLTSEVSSTLSPPSQ